MGKVWLRNRSFGHWTWHVVGCLGWQSTNLFFVFHFVGAPLRVRTGLSSCICLRWLVWLLIARRVRVLSKVKREATSQVRNNEVIKEAQQRTW